MRHGWRALLTCAAGAVAMTVSFGGPVPVAGRASATSACTERAMQVVAHTDDDLLFMNPDVGDDIAAGLCVRTVFLTAGDAGEGAGYWGGRETGERAAYARMAGVADEWTATDAGVPGVRLETLAGNPNVSLVFLRLPDGALRGGGFAGTGYASLTKLWDGAIPALATVDPASPVTYTKAGLTETLGRLIADFAPGTIRVQDSHSEIDADHADHRATAWFATAARAGYAAPHTLVHYLDYPTQHRPANVTGAALERKKAAFYAYAAHDPKACDSDRRCRGRRYAAWLRRQYVVVPPPAAP